MDHFPKMYSHITLIDGRKGIVVDYLGDAIMVDVWSKATDWETIMVTMIGDEFHPCVEEEDGIVYTLCHRKGARLHVTDDNIYTFLFGDYYEGDFFPLTQEKYHYLCNLLSIDINSDIETSWHTYFEYHQINHFMNAYQLVKEDSFYYVYGYNAANKTADALYRFYKGRFERYFPLESVWREMPEQRMILAERKPRYQRVSESEGMSLELLV